MVVDGSAKVFSGSGDDFSNDRTGLNLSRCLHCPGIVALFLEGLWRDFHLSEHDVVAKGSSMESKGTTDCEIVGSLPARLLNFVSVFLSGFENPDDFCNPVLKNRRWFLSVCGFRSKCIIGVSSEPYSWSDNP